ncbi:DUF7714 family protein [Methylomonas sp. MgM2]
MSGERLTVGGLKHRLNFVPLPYRRVSYQPYAGDMTEKAITEYLLPREVYRRTDIIILHNEQNQYAVVAVQRLRSDDLFVPVQALEILALPADCVFMAAPETDPANRSALAKLAVDRGIGSDKTLIVQGAFDHINIIHKPAPLILRVVEVAPPEPPKLFAMAQHVLGYADLPPVYLQLERIDLLSLAKTVQASAFLVPCRSGGLHEFGAPVFFLDERPAERRDWTLIGCERSLQFHRHYYGDEPPRLEMCPRQLATSSAMPTLLKCCLLEFDIELDGNTAVVPWGADLKMVEKALELLANGVEYA